MLLGYFLIVAIAGYFVLNIFVEEIKPGVRRATEEVLGDSAMLLAKFVELDVENGVIKTDKLSNAIMTLVKQEAEGLKNNVEGRQRKSLTDYRVYVVNDKGIVIYDTLGEDVGKDYSKWNDVLLSLKGLYGARSTRDTPSDDDSSVMYVAAPINYDKKIIGSLTVAKPNRALSPVVRRSELQMQVAGLFLLGIALLIGVIFVGWITHSISSLVKYAADIADGKEAELPRLESSELKSLAEAVQKMRVKLEGKNYVESYVHTLTHELKSPLAAIRGAAEILQEMPPPEATKRFSYNIEQQSKRLQLLVERMLLQANVESRLRIELQPVDLRQLIIDVLASKEAQAAKLRIELDAKIGAKSMLGSSMTVLGDSLLLSQAVTNLIENAFDFTPQDGIVRVILQRSGNMYQIIVVDNGSGIPAYAHDKIFDRFYSLPRPNGKGKSTGLGLSFVREVATLHKGSITLENSPDRGAMATLSLLRAS